MAVAVKPQQSISLIGATVVPLIWSPRSTAVTSTASAMTPMPTCPPVMVFDRALPSPSWMAMPKKRLSGSVLELIVQQLGRPGG